MSISFGTYSISLAYLLSILLLYSCFYALHILYLSCSFPFMFVFCACIIYFHITYLILSYTFIYNLILFIYGTFVCFHLIPFMYYIFLCFPYIILFIYLSLLSTFCTLLVRVLYFVLSIYYIHVLFSFPILFSCYIFIWLSILCTCICCHIFSYDIHILCFSYTILFI